MEKDWRIPSSEAEFGSSKQEELQIWFESAAGPWKIDPSGSFGDTWEDWFLGVRVISRRKLGDSQVSGLGHRVGSWPLLAPGEV